MILRLFFDITYASINENVVIKVHNTSYWHFQYKTSNKYFQIKYIKIVSLRQIEIWIASSTKVNMH